MNSVIIVIKEDRGMQDLQVEETLQQRLERLEEEDSEARTQQWFQNYERCARVNQASVIPAVAPVVPQKTLAKKPEESKANAQLLGRNTKMTNITCTVVPSTKKIQPEPEQKTMKAKRRTCIKKKVEKLPVAPTTPIILVDDSTNELEYQQNDDVQQAYAAMEQEISAEQDGQLEIEAAELECRLELLDYQAEQECYFGAQQDNSNESVQFITDLGFLCDQDYSDYSDHSQSTCEYSVEDRPEHYSPVLGDAF